MNYKAIPVTRPNLGELAELVPILGNIWESRIVTNNGPYHEAFEKALADFLSVEHVTLVANATLGLMLAVKVLELKGEVITSPFTFVATANALKWAGVTPVFVDIEPLSLNIDPTKIEAAITPDTSALMPVHTFGRACDVGAIAEIADTRKLKTIYDAAHLFGNNFTKGSVFDCGEMSVLSFHATKVFNTFEGGAIVSRDAETKKRLDALCNNGIDDSGQVAEIGLNAKMSEIHAAIGLLNLNGVGNSTSKLRSLDQRFREALCNIPGVRLLSYADAPTLNYNYFPVIIEKEYGLSRDELWSKLMGRGIHAKRYFHPLIPDLPAYQNIETGNTAEQLPVAHQVSNSILCLPMLTDLTTTQFNKIIRALEQ